MLFMMPVAAGAQDAIPALKGTWRGTGKILLFGSNLLHDGSGEELARDESPTRECTPLAKAGKLT